MKKKFALSWLCMLLCSMTYAYDFSAVNSDGVTIYYNIIGGGCEVTSGDIKYTGDVVIPSSVEYDSKTYAVKKIGLNGFRDCSGLTSVTVPGSVTSFAWFAFAGCMDLTSMTIPNSVTEIGSWSFQNCSGLTSINIPRSVKKIGVEAFYGCSSLSSINVQEGNVNYDSRENCNCIIETATNKLITGCKNSFIPNTITSINDYAFTKCSDLASIIIPNSVTSIGYSAFYGCTGLSSIIIPESINIIEEWAFRDCSNLTSLILPNSLTRIGSFAFAGCSKLTSLSLPDLVTHIDVYAFDYCSSLESLTIPKSVESIADGAFNGCSGLNHIILPNSELSVADMAFYNCYGLIDVYNFATVPQNIGDAFGSYRNVTLHVMEGYKDAYEATANWSKFTVVDDIKGDFIVTNVTRYDNVAYLHDAKQWPGKQMTMQVMLDNKADITAMQFEIVLPEGLSIDKNTHGNYALAFNSESNRADVTSHTLQSSQMENGGVLVLCYSNANDVILGNSGVVIDIPVTVSEDMAPDYYPIILNNVELTAKNKQKFKLGQIASLLEVPNYKMGDVNKDTEINVTDIVYTADYILGNNDPAFHREAADMDGDNGVSVTDIVYIADIIINGDQATSRSKAAARTVGTATLEIAPFTVPAGEGKTVTLDLSNANRQVTAFQCDLYLPEGISIDRNSRGNYMISFDAIADRTDYTCHTISASDQKDGAVKFLCYSVSNIAFTGEGGALIDIPLSVSSSMAEGNYDVRIDNAIITCTDKSEIRPSAMTVTATVTGNMATAIGNVSTVPAAADIYNLNGQRLSSPTNGIVIINGKKVAVMK